MLKTCYIGTGTERVDFRFEGGGKGEKYLRKRIDRALAWNCELFIQVDDHQSIWIGRNALANATIVIKPATEAQP